MRRLGVSFGRAAAAIGVLACMAGTDVATAEPRLELHRKWVEEKDTDGLYPAVSTKGHFSIVSPIPFNDYTIIADDPNVGQLVLHGLGSKSTDGYEFGAIETEMNDKTESPDISALIDGVAKKFGEDISPFKIEKMGDEEFAFAEIIGAQRSAFARVSKTSRSTFAVVCEYPTEQRDTAKDLCSDYLSSFRLSR